MNAWEALADRKILVEGTAEGAALAWLLGAVEGFGRELSEGDLMEQVASEQLAMICHDALDFYDGWEGASDE